MLAFRFHRSPAETIISSKENGNFTFGIDLGFRQIWLETIRSPTTIHQKMQNNTLTTPTTYPQIERNELSVVIYRIDGARLLKISVEFHFNNYYQQRVAASLENFANVQWLQISIWIIYEVMRYFWEKLSITYLTGSNEATLSSIRWKVADATVVGRNKCQRRRSMLLICLIKGNLEC